MNLLPLIILFACFATCFGEKARYDNYRVYSVEVENDQQFKALQQFEGGQGGISFLETPTRTHQKTELLVPPHQFAGIQDFFRSLDLKNHLKIENLQKLIDEEQPPNLTRDSSFAFDKYNDLKTIYSWLDELLEQYPDVLTNYNYGKSYEKRQLRAVKVSHKEGNPTIFIESTIHSREWITAATTTYFLNQLLTSNDTEIQNLAENYDWVIVPVVNVDGYDYTFSKNRLWRKTRKPYLLGLCFGADGNRNFDIHHGEEGSSSNPCSETYAGPKPFSEPETLALSQFIKTFNNIKLYLSFHSYSQLLLFPYGYTTKHTANYDDLNEIGQKSKEAIAQRYGTEYTVGDIADTIYPASGSTVDWVYDVQNVTLAYAFEFRDKGEYGFILPADQIIPNSLEIIDGLKAMVAEAEDLQYL